MPSSRIIVSSDAFAGVFLITQFGRSELSASLEQSEVPTREQLILPLTWRTLGSNPYEIVAEAHNR